MKTKTKCYLCEKEIPDIDGAEYMTVNGKDLCMRCYNFIQQRKAVKEYLEKEGKSETTL